jgi:hypothetical protein
VKNSFRRLRKFSNDVVVERLREIERSGLIKNDILSIVIAKSSKTKTLLNLYMVNNFILKNYSLNKGAEKMDFETLIDDFLTLFLAGIKFFNYLNL